MAIVLPVLFASLFASSDQVGASRHSTRCSQILPICLEEISKAKTNQSKFLLSNGPTFPETDNAVYLCFSPSGEIIGSLDEMAYKTGCAQCQGRRVLYSVAISVRDSIDKLAPRTLSIRITYPSSLSEEKRNHKEFYSHIP